MAKKLRPFGSMANSMMEIAGKSFREKQQQTEAEDWDKNLRIGANKKAEQLFGKDNAITGDILVDMPAIERDYVIKQAGTHIPITKAQALEDYKTKEDMFRVGFIDDPYDTERLWKPKSPTVTPILHGAAKGGYLIRLGNGKPMLLKGSFGYRLMTNEEKKAAGFPEHLVMEIENKGGTK